mgnify:CR=1 FL=1
MYKTNLRDIRFPTENAPVILQKGLINKDDFTHSDANVTLYQTPYAIAKRIFVWTDIEVLLNEWTTVGNGDYDALEKAYSDFESKSDNTDVKWTAFTEPIYIKCVTPQPKCFTEINKCMNNAESSVSESAPEVIEEPISEQVEEEVISEEETSVESEQQEAVAEEPEFHEDGEPVPEVIDDQPEEVVEETTSEQETESVAVPVTPTQQNNNQNYTRINNKRNKHNRR